MFENSRVHIIVAIVIYNIIVAVLVSAYIVFTTEQITETQLDGHEDIDSLKDLKLENTGLKETFNDIPNWIWFILFVPQNLVLLYLLATIFFPAITNN